MPGTFSRYFVEAPGNDILADHWNGEFDNIITNMTPSGVDDASSNATAMQTVENPGGVGTESLPTSLLGELRRLRYMIKAVTGEAQWYSPVTSSLADIAAQGLPIGSIIPFYDFNGDLTFDTDFWVYCDGQTATVGGVSRALPDLSGRYLVGFGTTTDEVQLLTLGGAATGGTFTITFNGQTTAAINWNDSAATATSKFEAISTLGSGNAVITIPSTTTYVITFTGDLAGTDLNQVTVSSSLTNPGAVTITPSTTTAGAGGDIDSATWSTTPLGTSVYDQSHTHDTNIASFTSGGSSAANTGSGGAHDHGGRTANITTDTISNDTYRVYDDTGGSSTTHKLDVSAGPQDEGWHDHDILTSTTHTHTITHTHSIDPANTTSTSAVINTQPKSVRVRFLMRKA